MLIGSFLEALGLGMLIPLLQNTFNENLNFNIFFLEFNFIKNIKIENLILLFFGTIFLKNILLLIILYFQQHFSFSLGKFTCDKLFYSYLKKNTLYFSDINPSIIIRNVITETNGVIGIAISLTTIFREFLILIFIFSLLILVNFKFVFYLSIIITVFLFIYYFPTKKIIKKNSYLKQKFSGQQIKLLNHLIDSIVELKLLKLNEYFMNKFSKLTYDFSNSGKKIKFFALSSAYFFELFLSFFLISILFIYTQNNDLYRFELSMLISYSSIFGLALFRILPSINKIILSVNDINVNSPSLSVVTDEIFNKSDEDEILDKKTIKINKFISFKDISFSYKNKKIFKNINLEIYKNTIIGLSGPSGVGKSTFIKILSGLISPETGELYIDNKKNSFVNLRKISYLVPQNSTLIDETLEENISFKEDKHNFSLIKKSVEFAELKKLYENMIDKNLGSSGKKISGGERQRINLARMFYHLRQFIIFDESTNSLDRITEEKILNKLTSLKKGRIILIISHNEKFKKICDSVYKLQNNNLKKIK